jgi:hypothetical protein
MWAKAPSVDVTAATIEDRREFLESGLTPLDCNTCGTWVLVKKNSEHHTSIQWITGTDSCPELAAHTGPRGLLDTCSKLRGAIEHAVREGLLEVPDG